MAEPSFTEDVNTKDAIQAKDVEYIRLGNTTFEVTSFYEGDTALLDLMKNALKREAQTILRQADKT